MQIIILSLYYTTTFLIYFIQVNSNSLNIIMSDSEPIESCQLIGFAGIMVQIVLGALSFSVLIYKRYTESPKRAWKIWSMDTSKQLVSQFLAHIINVAISMQLSSQLDSDACIWYFTTNVLDNTVGVLLCVGILGVIQQMILYPNYTRFQSGNYYAILDSYEQEKMFVGDDPNLTILKPFQITKKKQIYAISYFDWFVQFIIWNIIVVVSKTLLFYLQVLLSGPLVSIVGVLIGWIQPYETLQLILVIIVAPVIMNGLAFWFQDNFLKKKITPQGEEEPRGRGRDEKIQDGTSTGSERPDGQQMLL